MVDKARANENKKSAITHRQLEVLGEHIRNLRRLRHLSQVELAVRAGFVGAYYSAIERGKLNFSVVNLIKIARALGVEVGALFPPISELTEIEDDEQVDKEQGASEPEANAYQVTDGSGPTVPGGPIEIESGGRTAPELLLSTGAVARMLGVTRRTIDRWVHSGILVPAARVEEQQGRYNSLFRREDIDRAIRQRQR